MRSLLHFVFLLAFMCVAHLPKGYAQQSFGHYENSVNLFNAGQTQQALNEVDKLLKIEPQNIDALYLRAYFYLSTEQKQKALEDYTAILNLETTHDGALTNRALLYMEEEKYDLAMTDINRRIKNDPKNWMALYDRAYCHALNNNYKDAIADFEKVILYNPDYTPAYANMGFSKINLITQNGLLPTKADETTDACQDLKKAQSMGDTTVVKMIEKFCNH